MLGLSSAFGNHKLVGFLVKSYPSIELNHVSTIDWIGDLMYKQKLHVFLATVFSPPAVQSSGGYSCM